LKLADVFTEQIKTISVHINVKLSGNLSPNAIDLYKAPWQFDTCFIYKYMLN